MTDLDQMSGAQRRRRPPIGRRTLFALPGVAVVAVALAVAPARLEEWLVGPSSGALKWGPALFLRLLLFHGLLLVWLAARGWCSADTAGRDSDLATAGRRPVTTAESAALAAIIGLAVLLRVWRLETDLWLDEVLTLVDFVRLPLRQIVCVFPSQNQHPLYSVLAHLSVAALGESHAVVRLPAVVFGVAGVWAVWLLARWMASPGEALLAALLMAVSYHHVWFSQNARGYTALLFFALFGTWLWRRADECPSVSRWCCYAACAAIGLWTHLTLIFVLAGHGIAYLSEWSSRWRSNRHARVAPLLAWAVAASLTLQLHALALPEFLGVALHEVSLPSAWTQPTWVLRESALRLADGGMTLWLGVAVLCVVALGIVDLARRDRSVPIMLVGPPVIGAVAMVALGHNLWPRFFFFALGFLLIGLVRGLHAGAAMVWRTSDRLLARPLPVRASTAAALGCLMGAVISLGTIPRCYRPKQDFTGARDFVERKAEPSDAVVAVGLAQFAYSRYYAPHWAAADTPGDLERLRSTHGTVWVVYTLPIYMASALPALWETLQRTCLEPVDFPGTLGDGAITVCRIKGVPPDAVVNPRGFSSGRAALPPTVS